MTADDESAPREHRRELSACIVICTRSRTEPVEAAISSALGTSGGWPVYLIDQNDDDRVTTVIGALADDDRLRHIRTPTVGVGRARNLALSIVDEDIICFTDDDCVVPTDYVTRFREVFVAQPDIALVYCSVEPPGSQMSDGYVPVHEVSDRRVHRTWDQSARIDRLGLGAGMAVRTQVAREIGGFDPLLGPGGRFPSAEDRDIAIRLLLAGHPIAQEPRPRVVHHGFRAAGGAARALSKRDHIAIGAMLTKFIRTGHPSAIPQLFAFLVHSTAAAARISLSLARPAGAGKIVWTIAGLGRGMRPKIARDSCVFVDDTAGSQSSIAELPAMPRDT